MDVNQGAVTRVMGRHSVDTLIHGHTHRPDRHPIGNGERIVLGDWEAYGWVLTLDTNGYNLERFTIDGFNN
jgi:UDP-2,3-diacylglucosamine hydrolase